MTVSELIKRLSSLEKQEQEICLRNKNYFLVPIYDIIECSGDGDCYLLDDGAPITMKDAIDGLYAELGDEK